MVDNKVITIHEQWRSILGKKLPLIDPYHYVKLSEILDRKSTRLNSSHVRNSYAVFCLKKKSKLRVIGDEFSVRRIDMVPIESRLPCDAFRLAARHRNDEQIGVSADRFHLINY